MPIFRAYFLLFLLAFAGLTLGGCQTDDPKPKPASIELLTTGSWRLDQIRQNGQVTSSGADIKDQYSLTFRAGGTYSQKLLADNTVFNGTWALLNNNATLGLIDHKGTESQYKVESLTSSELRYSFTNKDGQLEERVFSAQP